MSALKGRPRLPRKRRRRGCPYRVPGRFPVRLRGCVCWGGCPRQLSRQRPRPQRFNVGALLASWALTSGRRAGREQAAISRVRFPANRACCELARFGSFGFQLGTEGNPAPAARDLQPCLTSPPRRRVRPDSRQSDGDSRAANITPCDLPQVAVPIAVPGRAWRGAWAAAAVRPAPRFPHFRGSSGERQGLKVGTGFADY
jgi:hypothetical protein